MKRGDEVYTEVVLDCKSATLQRIIKGIDSVIHSDGWRGYKKHFRVHHSKNEFARGNGTVKNFL